MSGIEVKVTRLPHGQDLPLPLYQSEHAAGLDLLAADETDRGAGGFGSTGR